MGEKATIDVGAVRESAYRSWAKEQRGRNRLNLLDLVEKSVPWWLVVIAATMFALSAPHTASTFNKITPGFGWIAPLGVEFGLLYAAFYKRIKTERYGLILTLERFLFLTSMIVNGAGAFSSVVSGANLSDLPLDAMLAGFGKLPASDQVTLVLVIFSMFIIPIGTLVAGHGLSEFVLERTGKGGAEAEKAKLNAEWKEAAPTILFQAYAEALINAGWTPGRARKTAAQYVAASTGKIVENGEIGEIGENQRITVEREALAKGEAKQRLNKLFHDDPQFVHYSIERQMELSGVGMSTLYKWRDANKPPVSSNGKGPEKHFDQEAQ
jgi:hypothetical protein